MIILQIPECTPSLNQTMRLGHWSKAARHRKRWSMLVLVAKSEARVFDLPKFPRAKVTIERHGGRTLDRDNLAGGMKALIDGLKDNGLIRDDSPAHIDLHLFQMPGGRGVQRKTVVRIEDTES